MDNLQSDLAAHCMKLEQQRDELLAALKELRGAEWMVTHDWGGDRNAINERVDAAIAKCES